MNYTHYIGEPGTGKTTLMWEKLRALREVEQDELVKEGYVRYHKFTKQKVIIFGVYEEGAVFAGTDRLAKTAPPKFREWIVANKEKYADWVLLSEGERFSNSPTLDWLFAETDMHLVSLKVSEEELERRRAARNNTQNESWMKGMATRIANLCEKYPHEVVEV
jgi:hypothetical protein